MVLGMRRPKVAKEPRTTLACVGTHTVAEVQMAEMDATQKRVWEVGRGARGGIQDQQYTDSL